MVVRPTLRSSIEVSHRVTQTTSSENSLEEETLLQISLTMMILEALVALVVSVCKDRSRNKENKSRGEASDSEAALWMMMTISSVGD